MVEPQSSKLITRVRFPSSALYLSFFFLLLLKIPISLRSVYGYLTFI